MPIERRYSSIVRVYDFFVTADILGCQVSCFTSFVGRTVIELSHNIFTDQSYQTVTLLMLPIACSDAEYTVLLHQCNKVVLLLGVKSFKYWSFRHNGVGTGKGSSC